MGGETRYLTIVAMVTTVVLLFCCDAGAQPGVTTKMGTLPDGATYLIDVPPNWNGVVVIEGK